MREIGVEHFKILCIKQYTDISKERLRTKEQKYINRYDAINNGLYIHELDDVLSSQQKENQMH